MWGHLPESYYLNEIHQFIWYNMRFVKENWHIGKSQCKRSFFTFFVVFELIYYLSSTIFCMAAICQTLFQTLEKQQWTNTLKICPHRICILLFFKSLLLKVLDMFLFPPNYSSSPPPSPKDLHLKEKIYKLSKVSSVLKEVKRQRRWTGTIKKWQF